MNIRKITSMTMLLTLVVLTINSIVLYVVPEGRIANWADWYFLGLTKGDWGAQHTTIGFLFVFAGILHVYYNWKPIVAYMKNKAKEIKVFTGSFNVALALTVFFIVGTYYNVPPMSTIMEISEHFKDSAAKKYGDPPYGHAESSSLKMFTKRENLDLTKSLELLKAAGIPVSGEKDILRDLADKTNKSPQQIYEIIKSAAIIPQKTSDSGVPSALPENPPSGLGKKTLDEICTEYGLDANKIIKGLEGRGIKAEAGAKLKEIAEPQGVTSMQIYEMMLEIVSGAPSALPEVPPSGLGKKTLDEICTEYGLDTDKIIKGLEGRGIKAEAGAKLKEIAEPQGVTPMQIYEMMLEIVSE